MQNAPNDGPDQSPPLLSPPPRRGRGVRRLNRVPIFFFVGGAMLVVAAVGYTYRERMADAAANTRAAEAKRPEPASGAAVLNGAPTEGEVKSARDRPPPAPRQRAPQPEKASELPSDHGTGSSLPNDEDAAATARRQAWQTYYAQVAGIEKAQFAAARSAMTADTGLPGSQRTAAGSPSATGGTAPASGMAGVPAGYPGAPVVPAGDAFGLPGYPSARIDATAQREKQAFLAQPGDATGASDDLGATLRMPASPYLVMAGTAIPAVMVGGINSDMPGIIVGQVAENVYDTATGRFLLIPQGARLIGEYDNSVSMGQTRIGVIWTRIIDPDGESIDLGAMEGADQGGEAGFHDRVNTHLWSKIGNAALISIAGAGAQLSQPQAVNGQNYNPQQIAAASLGQQFAELGEEYARAGLSIPNTLVVRPGYRFLVMVNKDMHLRPYADFRTADNGPLAGSD